MKDKELTVDKIRSQYEQSEPSELDVLKALDARVKKPARIFGFLYGSLGAMVLGAGMSLVMTDLGTILGMPETLFPGIAVGAVGMAMCCTTYPLYKKILTSRKKKYAPRILELCRRAAR